MALPTITLQGNLTADVELRFTKNGKEFVTFRVACNDRRKNDAGEWVDGDTTFMTVTSWRNTQSISKLMKGSSVIVTGTLRQRDYETPQGERRTTFDVNAETVAQVLRDKTGYSAPAQSADSWGTTAAPVWDDSEAPF